MWNLFLFRAEPVVFAEGHPLEDRKKVTIQDICPYPLISYTKESGMRRIIDDMFTKAQIMPNILCQFEDVNSMAGLVEKNQGIAIVTDSQALRNYNVTKAGVGYAIFPQNGLYGVCAESVSAACGGKIQGLHRSADKDKEISKQDLREGNRNAAGFRIRKIRKRVSPYGTCCHGEGGLRTGQSAIGET